jgi:hypothetical protein
MPPRDRKELAKLLENFVQEFGVRGKKAPMLFEEDPAPQRAR